MATASQGGFWDFLPMLMGGGGGFAGGAANPAQTGPAGPINIPAVPQTIQTPGASNQATQMEAFKRALGFALFGNVIGGALGKRNTAAEGITADTQKLIQSGQYGVSQQQMQQPGGFTPQPSALGQPNFFGNTAWQQPQQPFTPGTATNPAGGSSVATPGLSPAAMLSLTPALQQQLFENQMAQQHERNAGTEQAYQHLLDAEKIRLANENLGLDKAKEIRTGNYEQSQLSLDKQRIGLATKTEDRQASYQDARLALDKQQFALDQKKQSELTPYEKEEVKMHQAQLDLDKQKLDFAMQKELSDGKILDVGQKKFVMSQVLARNPNFGQAILAGYMKEQNLKPADLNSIRKMGAITGNGDPVQKVLDDPVASLRYLQLSSPGLVSIFDQQVQAAQGELPRVSSGSSGALATPTSPAAGPPPASSGASTGAPSVLAPGGASSTVQQPLESKYSLQVTKSGKEAVTSIDPIGKLNGKAVTYSELFDLVSKQLADRGVSDPSGEKRRALTQQWINSTAEHQKLEGQLSAARSPLTTHATEGR